MLSKKTDDHENRPFLGYDSRGYFRDAAAVAFEQEASLRSTAACGWFTAEVQIIESFAYSAAIGVALPQNARLRLPFRRHLPERQIHDLVAPLFRLGRSPHEEKRLDDLADVAVVLR